MATSAFATHPRSEAMAQMNITPLVDVMLVLLVIFMLAAPVVTGNLDMRLPQPSPDTPVNRPPQASLQVTADGSLVLDGQYMGKPALAQALANIARNAPTTVVSIQADEGAEYQAFTDALSTARSSGIRNIALGK